MQSQVVLWVKCCPLWSYVDFLSSLLEMILQNDYELQKRNPVLSLVLKIQLLPKNENNRVLRITRLESLSQQT